MLDFLSIGNGERENLLKFLLILDVVNICVLGYFGGYDWV